MYSSSGHIGGAGRPSAAPGLRQQAMGIGGQIPPYGGGGGGCGWGHHVGAIGVMRPPYGMGGQLPHTQQQQVQQPRQQGSSKGGGGGPPRREMDSLLEELKAKQRIQEQRKEVLKSVEASLNERGYGADGSWPQSDDAWAALASGCCGGVPLQAAAAAVASGAPFNCGGFCGGSAYSGGGGFGGGCGFSSGGTCGAMVGFGCGVGVGCAGCAGGAGCAGCGGCGGGGGVSLGGSSHRGDSQGVGLFLRDLPTSANEDTFLHLFGRYGCVTSVDLTYSNEKNTMRGYVMMDTRENAQRAKDALHDRDVDGVPLWIEWAPEGVPTRFEPDSDEAVRARATKDPCRRIVVQIPKDAKLRRIIDTMAKYVSQEGHPFEQKIMERESPDGDFGFLFSHGSPENTYYRWRTFAFGQGDNFKSWRTANFRLCEGGAWWRPPHCEAKHEEERRSRSTNFSSTPLRASGSGAMSTALNGAAAIVKPAALAVEVATESPAVASAEAPSSKPLSIPSTWTQEEVEEERERMRLEERATQERQKRDRDRRGVAGAKRLNDNDWDRLEKILRTITGSRALVCEAMVFCLDKADFAIEIAECITEALTIVETELPIKIARFMVVSDVLHNTNSSKQAAWAYRREFEKSLPDILEHFSVCLQRVESRIQADKARDQVLKILRVWEDWGLFAPQYIRGLEAALFVGVRSLRTLAARGDLSREPPWLESKLADWRRQHFSQLEKMCRTRGLRSSTFHLEASKDLTLEEAKREWLVDRLVCYELHWHEKEQERAAADAAAAKAAVEAAAAIRASRKKRFKEAMEEEIDEEATEDIDGFNFSDGEVDGEPLDIDDAGEMLRLADWALLQTSLLNTSCLGCSRTDKGILASIGAARPATITLVNGAAPAIVEMRPSAEVVLAAGAEAAGWPPPSSPPSKEDSDERGLKPRGFVTEEEEEEVLDIKRVEETSRSHQTSAADDVVFGKKGGTRLIDMRSIELEVIELRASLQDKGLFQDAIEDICNEKRQELIDEHEASLASPPRCSSEGPKEEDDASSSKSSEARREASRQKARAEAAAAAALGRGADRDKAREREKEKDADKVRKERSKDNKVERDCAKDVKPRSQKEKEKERDREREGEREKEKSRKDAGAKEKERDRDKGRTRSRSRSTSRRNGRERERPSREGRSWSRDRRKERKAVSRSRSRSPPPKKKARR